MRLLSKLWNEEAGIILSAEAVVVGTVAVVGLTAGMSTVATAVNEELKDVAFAIRSLDQSYCIPGHKGCGAMTAGSSFQQQPVQKSLELLGHVYDQAEKREKAVVPEKAQPERLQQQLKQQEMKKERSSEGNRSRKKRESEQLQKI